MSAPMASSSPSTPGPAALQLLAKGLELWLRQQCDQLSRCQIQLRGSVLQLLRGRLEGVDLEAEGASYQQLQIGSVILSSGPLAVRMGSLLKRQTVELEQPFAIAGSGWFGSTELQASFLTGAWRPMAEAACQALLECPHLSDLQLRQGRIAIWVADPATGLERSAELAVAVLEGQLELTVAEASAGHEQFRGRRHRLPGAPNIQLQSAQLDGQQLVIKGEARVFPAPATPTLASG